MTLGDLALVEAVAAALGDQAVGVGEGRVGEDLALGRGPAVRRPDLLEVLHLLDAGAGTGEAPERTPEIIGDGLGDGGAVLSQIDGRGEEVGPFEAAVALVQGPPGIHRAGGRDRHRAEGSDPSAPGARPLGLQAERPGRAARAVEADDLAGLGVPQHDEAVAADAARDRLEESQGRVGRHRRVHGRAAGAQDVDGGQGRQGVGRGRRAVRAPHRRARGEARAGDAVPAVDVRTAQIAVRHGLGDDRRRARRSGGGQRQGGKEGAAAHGAPQIANRTARDYGPFARRVTGQTDETRPSRSENRQTWAIWRL